MDTIIFTSSYGNVFPGHKAQSQIHALTKQPYFTIKHLNGQTSVRHEDFIYTNQKAAEAEANAYRAKTGVELVYARFEEKMKSEALSREHIATWARRNTDAFATQFEDYLVELARKNEPDLPRNEAIELGLRIMKHMGNFREAFSFVDHEAYAQIAASRLEGLHA